jgi:hypothetical protein
MLVQLQLSACIYNFLCLFNIQILNHC